MKLTTTTTILAFAPLTNALCLKSILQDNPSIADDGITCSPGQFKNSLQKIMRTSGRGDCGTLRQEIKDTFGVNPNGLNSLIRTACDEAPEPNIDPSVSFYDILDDSIISRNGDDVLDAVENESRFLKEFYDGNTFMNEEVTGSFNPVSRQIKSFYQNAATSEIVAWPDDSIDNFDSCELNTVMCCWVADRRADNDGNCATPLSENCVDADPADNTDLCYVDNTRSPQANHVDGGFILFPNNVEGPTHCHGFVFSDDESEESALYKANNLFYVSMYDHLRNRGYVRNVPGAPMCGCLEQMPTVSRSDCTQTEHDYYYTFTYNGDSSLSATVSGRKVKFISCDGETPNDLESKYEQMVDNEKVTDQMDAFNEIVVGSGNCENAINDFMEDNGFEAI